MKAVKLVKAQVRMGSDRRIELVKPVKRRVSGGEIDEIAGHDRYPASYIHRFHKLSAIAETSSHLLIHYFHRFHHHFAVTPLGAQSGYVPIDGPPALRRGTT